MLTRLRYLTLVLTLSVLVTFYLTLLLTIPVEEGARGDVTPKNGVKEVVAYSLRKQIEIESEEVSCDSIIDAGASDNVEKRRLWTQVPNTSFFVYGVYYDDRLEPFRYIRLLGMIKGNWNQTLYCQIQLKNNTYHITKAVKTEIWSKEWQKGDENTFNPSLISCYLPKNAKSKKFSININPCEINRKTFKIPLIEPKIRINLAKRKFFMTVCVKPLNFAKDISKRLMQWIEINKVLGANKFEFFVSKIPKKVRQLLEFYSRKYRSGFTVKNYENIEDFILNKLEGYEFDEQKRLSSSGNALITRQTSKGINEITKQEESSNTTEANPEAISGNVKTYRQNRLRALIRSKDVGTVNDTEASKRKIWQKRRNELIAYNDCLYRNLRSSHFVIPVDIDEIIVPKRFYTWEDTMGHLFTSAPHYLEEFASFSARNAYFLEEFSKDAPQKSAFFFEYNKRSEFSDEGESGKSFVSTRNSLTVFNHYSLDAIKPGIRKTYFLPVELVQMNHYKRTCSINLLPQCAKYLSSPVRIVDNLIKKYERDFLENYEKTLRDFNDFRTSSNKTAL